MEQEQKLTIKEKAANAAVGYLERLGWIVLDTDYKTKAGTIPIVAMDTDGLVYVAVEARKNAVPTKDVTSSTLDRYRARMREYIKDSQAENQDTKIRYDRITILVIAPDRALLRHHRNITGGR